MKKDTSVESFGASTGQTPPAPAAERMGKVEISPEAIANIAAQAIVENYGVVGLAARRLRNGRAEMLRPEHYRDGILVSFDGDKIVLELYIIIEYGLKVSEVAHHLMSRVKFEVERHLGREVAEVNVNVQGLRMPDEDGSKRSRRDRDKDS